MKTAYMIVLICIASCACVTFCYPSKPLNERSTELAWQAWLLVDQTNRQTDLGLLRRRITPKSVFIAPTFSPDSLPPCADGYKSDSMGRCIQIIKINESVHFDFLLQKLNEQFPDYDDGDDDEPDDEITSQTVGPFQLNIPLLGNTGDDVAIVVTPSNKKNDKNTIQVKRNGSDKFNVENVAATLGVKPEDVEMTTMAELTTTTVPTTTIQNQDTTTTLMDIFTTTEDDSTTTTTSETTTETTTLEGDAIFFQWRL